MSEAMHHPIDFKALQKGDVIGVEALRRLFRCTPDDTKWSLGVLQLRQQILRARPELTTRGEHNTIRVLHDSEIPGYALKLMAQGCSLVTTAREVTTKPITEDLTDAQKRAHESTAIAVGMVEADLKRSLAKSKRTFADMAAEARKLEPASPHG